MLPPEQLDLVCLSDARHLDQAESAHLGQILYVADTLGQFGKQLGLVGPGAGFTGGSSSSKGFGSISREELQGVLDAAAAGAALGGCAVGDGPEAKRVRDALAWLGCTYQALLKVGSG